VPWLINQSQSIRTRGALNVAILIFNGVTTRIRGRQFMHAEVLRAEHEVTKATRAEHIREVQENVKLDEISKDAGRKEIAKV
jgi:hypothetical protein